MESDNNLDELVSKIVSDITPQIKYLLTIQNKVIEDLELRINYIIDNHIIDIHYIESTLDKLLNLIQTDKTVLLYKKLCHYYYFINKEHALEYVQFYLEMYPEEKENIKKKINKKSSH